MTHICFLRMGATPFFLTHGQGEFGGAEVRAVTFARELARRGHAVDFVVAPHTDLRRTTEEGIHVLPLSYRLRGVPKLLQSLRGRWITSPVPFAAIDQIEAPIIACFGVHRPTPEVIAAARAAGKRTILFLTSSEDAFPIGGDMGKLHRIRQQHAFAIRSADVVIAQTVSQCQQLEQHFQRTGVLIANPIDTRVTQQALSQQRAHVLWVGRADTDSKRVNLCLELATQCPRIPFRVVINGGDPQVFDELMAAKPENLHVDTIVPFDQIESLYRSAAVLINTSVSEGFPNAFLQAMKFGTPILSLSVDPDDILNRYACGAVAGSMPRMADLLADYWPVGPEAEKQGQRGRSYVMEHHELSTCVDQLVKVIDGMTTRKSAA